MPRTSIAGLAAATSALVMAVSPIMAESASAQYAPPPDYQQGYDRDAPPPPDYRQGYDRDAPPPGYDSRDGYDAPPEPGPPPGYDGTQPPPPPPGYAPQGGYAGSDADARYAEDAEAWARNNCVKSQSNVGAGAVVGGIIGAIVGSGLAGRHDRGGAVVAGAAVGAVGGAAIASTTQGDTSPGCPPGYVVRHDAAAYSYGGGPDYYYAAPSWYRPWVFIGGSWTYRPYPYHNWYYRTYRAPRGYYRDNRYGRGDWHSGRGGNWHGDRDHDHDWRDRH